MSVRWLLRNAAMPLLVLVVAAAADPTVGPVAAGKKDPDARGPRITMTLRGRRGELGGGQKGLVPNNPSKDLVVLLKIEGVPDRLRNKLFFEASFTAAGEKRTFNLMSVPTTGHVWAAGVVPIRADKMTVSLGGGTPPLIVSLPKAIAETVKAAD
jgi:hypothetical protein